AAEAARTARADGSGRAAGAAAGRAHRAAAIAAWPRGTGGAAGVLRLGGELLEVLADLQARGDRPVRVVRQLQRVDAADGGDAPLQHLLDVERVLQVDRRRVIGLLEGAILAGAERLPGNEQVVLRGVLPQAERQ